MNYIRCGNWRPFTKVYCYIDSTDYELDKVAAKYGKRLVNVFKEMCNNDHPDMLLVFANIRKKDMEFFEETIFPEVNRNLLVKFGDRYKQVCEQFELMGQEAHRMREERENGKSI